MKCRDNRLAAGALSSVVELLSPATLINHEVQEFFAGLSAHSDVASELGAALTRLGEYQIFYSRQSEYGALYAVTAQIAFCGAAGMRDTYWRLRPSDLSIARATGASPASIGPEWVRIECFRDDWPNPDLPHWALRAYDYARTGT